MNERTRVIGLGALIVATLVVYGVIRSASGDVNRDARRLLPYQALARTAPDADQRMFDAIHRGLLVAERARAETGRWAEPSLLASKGADAFAAERYRWQLTRRGAVAEYLAIPSEPSDPAWLLKIQEPEPGALPDPAPNDEEHHRLPDGTTLHLYIWMQRLGGRVPAQFVPSPESSGWTQILYEPPNPILAPRS